MRKLTARHLLSRVHHFTDRMATAYDEEDIQTKMEQMDRVMKEIDQFDRSIGPGLSLGRFLRTGEPRSPGATRQHNHWPTPPH